MMFLLRLCFRVYETPKYLLGRDLDKQAVEVVQNVAKPNKTTTWLTISHFEAVDAELGVQETNASRAPNNDSRNIVKRSLDKFKPESFGRLLPHLVLHCHSR